MSIGTTHRRCSFRRSRLRVLRSERGSWRAGRATSPAFSSTRRHHRSRSGNETRSPQVEQPVQAFTADSRFPESMPRSRRRGAAYVFGHGMSGLSANRMSNTRAMVAPILHAQHRPRSHAGGHATSPPEPSLHTLRICLSPMPSARHICATR